MTSIVEGEYTENDVRKDFTPSERVAIANAVEHEIGNRQGRRDGAEPPQKIGEAHTRHNRQTSSIAASKAGFGNPETYRQAKSVVAKGAPELVDAMDAGKVSIAAHTCILSPNSI